MTLNLVDEATLSRLFRLPASQACSAVGRRNDVGVVRVWSASPEWLAALILPISTARHCRSTRGRPFRLAGSESEISVG